MAEGVQSGLVQATQVAREAPVQRASNGINYAAYGDIRLEERELQRMVEAVPASVAAALNRKAYYFVPLAMSESRSPVSGASGTSGDTTLIAPVYTTEFSDQAICHRNVSLGDSDGVFISTRLLGDRFALALDRKSTRLNSSHVEISYAVFCLKKKKKQQSQSTSIQKQKYKQKAV